MSNKTQQAFETAFADILVGIEESLTKMSDQEREEAIRRAGAILERSRRLAQKEPPKEPEP